MITPENAVDHLRRGEVQDRLDADTYRAVTLVLAMLNDARNQRDDCRAELAEFQAGWHSVFGKVEDPS
jgi:hypothetical protein